MQVDGYPEVVVKSAAHSKGVVVAKVPNGDSLAIVDDYGEYLSVRWQDVEGYLKGFGGLGLRFQRQFVKTFMYTHIFLAPGPLDDERHFQNVPIELLRL